MILTPTNSRARSYNAVLLLCFLAATPGFSRDWFVSAKGDDAATGTTAATAFRTLQKAADLTEPGDTVLVGDGIYLDAPTADSQPLPSLIDKDTIGATSLLRITQSGRPDAWITWKAAPGQHPELRPQSWAGIAIHASYIAIDGLTITGANDALVLINAIKEGKNEKADPRYNTNGIIVEGRHLSPERKPHHVIIRNCTVSKCPGGGIVGLEMDHLTIEDNRIFDNCWYMRYGGSGITTLNNWASDDAPGYHVVIQRNLVWNNKTLVPWGAIGKLSDGNGILLDVTDGKASGAANPNVDTAANPTGTTGAALPDPNAASLNPERPIWKYRALIANNVSAYNGGSGIHTFRTRHVDIINNTTYWNGSVVGYEELFPNRSEDVVILNNIIVPRPGAAVTSNNRNKNIHWDYNLYTDDQKISKGEHDIIADPQFISIRRDLLEANFRLQHGSPGLDRGTDEVAQPTDLTGNIRPVGKARDRGAYEQ